MTGLTDCSADIVLNYIAGKTTIPSPPTTNSALFTAVGTEGAPQFFVSHVPTP
jgi:hypothetical protein